MSPELIGALIGLFLGVISLQAIRVVANQIEATPTEYDSDGKPKGDKRKIASLLRVVGWFDVVLFSVIGYVVGPMFL